MDTELPTSPLLARLFAENPWTLALPLVVLAAGLAWWGNRTDRVRPILAGVALLLAAAATVAGAAFAHSPGKHAAERARALVTAAEAGDIDAIRACFADDAVLHYGSPESPGDDLARLMHAAEGLRGRNRIESNAVTELSLATVDDDHGQVLLGCRTATASSYGAVPTRWWMSVRRMPDGRWLIERLAWLTLMGQAPQRGVM